MRQAALSKYRQVLRLHQTALPKREIKEANLYVKSVFKQCSLIFDNHVDEYNKMMKKKGEGLLDMDKHQDEHNDTNKPEIDKGKEATKDEFSSTENLAKRIVTTKKKKKKETKKTKSKKKKQNKKDEMVNPEELFQTYMLRLDNYLQKVGSLTVKGSSNIDVSDPSYWNQYYQSILSGYKQKVSEQDQSSEKLHLLQYLYDIADDIERDWYGTYFTLLQQNPPFKGLKQKDRKKVNILILGNGISVLPFELMEDGYQNITISDVSPVALKISKICYNEFVNDYLGLENSSHLKVSFQKLDITDMSSDVAPNQYDFVIDKAVFDALYLSPDNSSENNHESQEEHNPDEKDQKSSDINNENEEIYIQKCKKAVSEVQHVLKPGGKWVIVTPYEYEQNILGENVKHIFVKDLSMHIYLVTKDEKKHSI